MNPNAHLATFQTLMVTNVAIILLCIVIGGLIKGYRSLRYATKQQIASAVFIALCILFIVVCEVGVYLYLYRWITGLGIYE